MRGHWFALQENQYFFTYLAPYFISCDPLCLFSWQNKEQCERGPACLFIHATSHEEEEFKRSGYLPPHVRYGATKTISINAYYSISSNTQPPDHECKIWNCSLFIQRTQSKITFEPTTRILSSKPGIFPTTLRTMMNANSVSIGFGTPMKTGSSRRFNRYLTTYMWVSS